MKLLHVIRGTDPESGGPIEALLRFSEIWVKEGHEVEIVSLESQTTANKSALPIPVTALGYGKGKYGYNKDLVPWLKANAPRFDAVILHGLWNYSSLGSWRALKHLSVPYFIFIHGMMDPWFRDSNRLKHFAKQLFWWLGEGRVLRDASGVLFTCEEEKLRSRGVFRGPAYTERVTLLGTADPVGDPDAEKAAFANAFPELATKPFLLFISRIHPKKGCDLLIKAFAQKANDIDLQLVIAGPDQVGWVQELKSLAQSLGVADRVHWPGMLKGELKWGAFRSAAAMILPSHQENFGFVVAEAMACGTPVLISDKVNIWREVLDASAGFVDADDLDGTKRLITNFLRLTPRQREEMADAARQGYLRYFNVETAARDFIRMIESEIASAAPHGIEIVQNRA